MEAHFDKVVAIRANVYVVSLRALVAEHLISKSLHLSCHLSSTFVIPSLSSSFFF